MINAIGHDGFTIFSNHDTGKIALPVENANAREVEEAMEHFGQELHKVKTVSMDMSPTYALVVDNLMPRAGQIKEFESVIKMIRKHEDEIINFFSHGMTTARAERLNGMIQRFVTNNYGIKDKDFSLYRIANYFS